MNNTMYVVPKKGVKVRLPDKPNDHLPEDGAEVPRNSYWLRRLNEGDVKQFKKPSKSAKSKE